MEDNTMSNEIKLFEGNQIRSAWDNEAWDNEKEE